MDVWELVRTNMYTLPVVLGIGAGALGLAAWALSRKRKLPPGPNLLRLIVAVIREGGNSQHITTWMTKEYGEVLSFYLGRQLIVIINSHEKIREVFVKRNQDFANRPRFLYSDILNLNDDLQGSGHQLKRNKSKRHMYLFPEKLFFTQHEPQLIKEYRNFFTRSLQKHALNLISAEHKLETEIHKAIAYLRQHSGEEIDPSKLIQRALANMFTSILFSTTYEHGDPALDEIIQMAFHANDIMIEHEGTMIEMFPRWLGRLIYSRQIREMQKTFKGIRDWVQTEIDNHRTILDPDNPRDLTDVYLLNSSGDAVGQERILDTLISVFPDTVESTGDLIRFVLLYIIHNPDVQERLHVDLENTVGTTNTPSLKHRKELAYVQAVILETMRCCEFTPSSGLHCAYEDTTLDGYHIPKEARIIGNFSIIHNDPELFSKPERFDPLRFLEADGSLSNAEHFIPFSLGTRSCVGEPLVKSATFLMIANMLHEFRFSFPASAAPPPLKKSKKTKIFACPDSYKVFVQPKCH